MPRLAMDYSKTVIYKLVCKDLTIKDCYVGHTTDFTKRKYSHKSDFKNEKKMNLKVYKMIRENGGWENWDMIEIEKYPCKDNNEARSRERYWVEKENPKLNSYKPYASKEEKKKYNIDYCYEYRKQNRQRLLNEKKEYYKKNKDELNKKHTSYRELNRIKINNQNKEYYKKNKDEINRIRREKYYNIVNGKKHPTDDNTRPEI
jgi:hypothetical protein